MASGSIILSGLEFMSYRVVDMEIKTLPSIGMLFVGINAESGWDFGIGFSDITFEPDEKLYIVPLAVTMRLLQIDGGEKRPSEEPYLSAQATISGVFRFTEECVMNEELREKMIKQQAPAILLPYLRATMSTMLVSAGFGGVTMPLINIYDMAGKNKPANIITASKEKGTASKKKILPRKKKA